MSTAPGAATSWENPAVDTWYDGYFRDETPPSAEPDETAPAGDVEGVEGVPAAPQGRAARRRQRARWKKNQRRAVVATAVALVGGGLTVASMDRGSGDKAQAATAPERPNVGLPEQQRTELTRPASTPSDTGTTPGTDTPSSHPSPTNAARESVTTSRTTRQFTRPDAASTPRPTATTVPQTQTVTQPSGGTGSGSGGGEAAEQQTPAPAPTDGADSGATPAPANPAPQETTPAQLCVLNLLCLG
ncbi:hypothetical protein [Streptomyces sp. NBC_01092]|uniref:SCO2400 family protein n=1 Tax=Streptomyces sp. NBC_01092 TaxID=2903748 RepID=UPI003865416D|nr:hypothetical protein OG254_05835 [Streptomyces sp. NBC_01092]